MADKDLKKLSRLELLEILVEKSRRIDALEAEVAALKQQLYSRELQIQQAGSLAEAAVRLNQVFEAAQAAADQYLDNIKLQAGALNQIENYDEYYSETYANPQEPVLPEPEPVSKQESQEISQPKEPDNPADMIKARLMQAADSGKGILEKAMKKMETFKAEHPDPLQTITELIESKTNRTPKGLETQKKETKEPQEEALCQTSKLKEAESEAEKAEEASAAEVQNPEENGLEDKETPSLESKTSLEAQDEETVQEEKKEPEADVSKKEPQEKTARPDLESSKREASSQEQPANEPDSPQPEQTLEL